MTRRPPQKVTCVALDFDNTIAFHRQGYEGLYEIFTRSGVPLRTVKQAYLISRDGGFHINGMLQVIRTRFRHPLRGQTTAIRKEFAGWLADVLIPYPESVTILKKWKRHVPVVIVTFGHPQHQMEKIALLNIPHTRTYPVASDKAKPKVLKQLTKKYGTPILFIDDRPSVLDLIRKSGLTPKDVITARVVRPGNRYNKDRTRYRHLRVRSFRELAPLV